MAVDLKTLSLKQLAEMYNEGARRLGRKTVNRFSDAEAGVRRVQDVLAACDAAGLGDDGPAPGPSERSIPKAPPAARKTPKVAKAKKPPGAPKEKGGGSKPRLDPNLKLFPVYEPNPFRFNTMVWSSYELVRKRAGLTRAEYLKADGHPRKLWWFLKDGIVSETKVTPKKHEG